jgi:hypothetical protein
LDAQVGKVIAQDGDEVFALPVVRVVLSERNLRTLLLTIQDEHNDVTRLVPEAGILLSIASEPNDVHYKDREAGLMSEDVELKLAAEELGDEDTLFIPPNMEMQ